MQGALGDQATRNRATSTRTNAGWIVLVSLGLLLGGLAIAQGTAAQAPGPIAEPVHVNLQEDPADGEAKNLVAEAFDANAGLTVSGATEPGALIIVCENGQPDCNTDSIQTAIDFAAPNDTIVVRPGTYTEGPETSLNIDTAGLTILAEHAATHIHPAFDEDADRPEFDPQGADAGVAFEAELGEVTFEGFNITGNWAACGICQGLSGMAGTSPQIIDNVVDEPEQTDTHGNTIQITGENASVIGNVVSVPHQVSPDWTATGILAFSTINATIEDNVVESSPDDACIAVGGGMFGFRDAVDNTVRGNTIESTDEDRTYACDEGVLVQGGALGTTVEGNQIQDTQEGIDVDAVPDRDAFPEGTSINDNTLEDNAVQVTSDDPTLDLDEVLDENTFDRAVVVRDDSGEEIAVQTIFSSIQDGIDETQDGFLVDVREGTYAEALDITSVDGITLQGAGSDAVTIDASGASGRSISAEYTTGDGATDVRLEGFTLIGTSDDYGLKLAFINGLGVEDVVVQDAQRTAIDLNTVENVTLSDVEATGTASGNGISVRNAVNVTIAGATTSDNAWGGLAFYAPGEESVENAVVRDSTFTGEAAGIYAQYNDLDITLDNVDLTDNEIGFGMLLFGDLVPTAYEVEIHDSTIEGNSDVGVLDQGTGDLSIEGTNITANGGTGVHLDGEGNSLDVSGTLFEDNGVGLQVDADFAVVSVEGATFSGNGVAVEHTAETVSTVVRDSQISGNDAGIVNTAQNALVDARGNYWGSPTGPSAQGNDLVATGDSVEGDVVYRNWCVTQDCSITASGDVNVEG